ncbi:CYTH and CHAD domain-containing protein [Methylopila sp. M107]|uniref:CYTH and CHAD domain-containing protein n=1 Tax=Methylopila sp. M107 TaxID=1101190 RepID=UPI0003788454|nr:CYTH and CHAD domain-containing protein [Methylopila sp. M107]
MADPTETELKLDCSLADLERLKSHPLLAAAKRRPAVNMRSVYFDAEDRRLRDAGMTLRVRTARRRHLQTVKAEGDGMLERPEWERRVATDQPDLTAIEATPAAALLADGAPLVPVFATEIRRRTFLVQHGQSEIEAALDDGRIVAGADGRVSPIAELELELKSGTAADLFTLAAALSESVELRLGVRSKSERGFRLADDLSRAPEHAGKLILRADMSTAEAFRAVAHGCIRQIRLNEEILLERPEVEALHQMRVGVRRFRSAISLFGKLVRDAECERLILELKRLSQPFGRGRNLDVFLAETLPQERERRPDEAGMLNLEKQFEVDRAEAHDAIALALRSAEWRNVTLALLAWVNAGPWLAPEDAATAAALSGPASDFAAATLDRRRKQLKKRGRDFKSLSVEERHEVRIVAKKLRYGAQFFASLYAGEKQAERHKAFVKALKRLQGKLGALNDIATARELVSYAAAHRLKGASSVFAAGLTIGDMEANAPKLLRESAEAYEALIKQRPFWR